MSDSKEILRPFRLCVLPLIFLVLIMITPTVKAELATVDEMQQVCQNWVTEMVNIRGNWAGETNPEIIAMNEVYSGDTLIARYYSISPRGFVVVPVLKEMMPVKVYSDESNLDIDQENGLIALLREMLSSRMNLYASEYGSLEAAQPEGDFAVFGQGQRSLWDKYAVSAEAFATKADINNSLAVDDAGPLLTSSWHQGDPYDQFCPMGDGGIVAVGCVATAIAQIMKFWEWPTSGVGSHTYLWAGDYSCGGSTPAEYLSADFTNDYDWANMPDSCNGVTPCTSTEEAALAELNYEVGVACDMDYGACASGSYSSSALKAFSTYFKYSIEATSVNRTQYSLLGWYNLIKEEIDNGRPIDYFISRHSIVCDGYREFGGQYQYHMNYGWGGSFTAWFVLDSLYCYWEPEDHCPSAQDNMIINIKPQTEPIISCYGQMVDDSNGDSDGHADINEEIELYVNITNNGWDAENAVGTLSSADSYVTITTSTAAFESIIPWGDSATTQTPFVIEISPSCPDPHIAVLTMNITADGGYTIIDTVYLFVGDTPGFTDDMESGDAYWSLATMTPTYGNEWHLETYRHHNGSSSWKAGGLGSDNYSDNLDACLITPPFLLPSGAELKFWHWIDAEEDAGNTAWDSGYSDDFRR